MALNTTNQILKKSKKKKRKKKVNYVYLKTCDLIDCTRIVEVTNKWFIVEFDLEENKELVKDLNIFFLSELDKQEYKKKTGHGYMTGNLFVTCKIMK